MSHGDPQYDLGFQEANAWVTQEAGRRERSAIDQVLLCSQVSLVSLLLRFELFAVDSIICTGALQRTLKSTIWCLARRFHTFCVRNGKVLSLLVPVKNDAACTQFAVTFTGVHPDLKCSFHQTPKKAVAMIPGPCWRFVSHPSSWADHTIPRAPLPGHCHYHWGLLLMTTLIRVVAFSGSRFLTAARTHLHRRLLTVSTVSMTPESQLDAAFMRESAL